MTETLTVGDLTFEVRHSARRRTLEIVVDRGGELRVLAPPGLPEGTIEAFVREKSFWLHTKLAEKERMKPNRPGKRYATGEGFHYVGRTYRMLLVDEQEQPVKLVKGRFRLRRRDAGEGRRHLVRWYTRHAEPWLKQRAAPWATRIGVEVDSVTVRDLGNRWGSCNPTGSINFHWATIQLPPSVIDYVVVHELAHLHEPRHTPEFWRQVERAMPDYEERKRWLADNGAEYVRV